MASLGHSKLHEDLQAAFLRYREGRYDADLDSKELNVILNDLLQFTESNFPKLTVFA